MALRRNILLFHQGALGDFVVTWPLALGLGRVFAQSRIFYVTDPGKGLLAEKVLRVESADANGGWHQLYAMEPQLPAPAAARLAGASQIIRFGGEAGDAWAGNVARLAPEAAVMTLSTTPPERFGGHLADFILSQLKASPVIEAAMGQMLKSIASRGVGGGASASGPVVLHPGAGSPAKCWPVERFVELASRLKDAQVAVEVIVGEVERERWPAEKIRSFQHVARIREPKTLVELAEIIAGASAFVGNDSGPGHLAGILGIPTYSIFGPSDWRRWRPLGPRVRVIVGPLDQTSAASVWQAVRERSAEGQPRISE